MKRKRVFYSWFLPALLAVPAIGLASELVAPTATPQRSPSAESALDTRPWISINAIGPVEPSSNDIAGRFHKNGDVGELIKYHSAGASKTFTGPLGESLHVFMLAVRGEPEKATTLIEQLRPSDDEQLFFVTLSAALIAHANGKQDVASKRVDAALKLRPNHPFALNLKGQLLAKTGAFSEAQMAFRQAIQASPRLAAAHSNLGSAYYLAGNKQAAYESFGTAEELDPGFCPALVGKATILREVGMLQDAAQHLQRCLDVGEGNLEVRRQLAPLYLVLGNIADARKTAQGLEDDDTDLSRLVFTEFALHRGDIDEAKRLLGALDKPAVRAQYLNAVILLQQRRTADADNQLSALLRQVPNFPDAQLLSWATRFSANSQHAMTGLKPLLEIPSVAPLANMLLACAQATRGDMSTAAALWNEAQGGIQGLQFTGVTSEQLQRSLSNKGQGDLALGLFLYARGFQPAAQTYLQRAVEAAPQSLAGNYLAAANSFSLGEFARARRQLHQALKTAPDFAAAHHLLGEVYARTEGGSLERAVQHYVQAARVAPSAGLLMKLSLYQDRLGNLGGVAEALDAYIALQPYSFIGYNQLAWAYAKRRQHLEKALALSKKAYALNPENVSVLDTKGWIHLLLGQRDRATELLSKANRLANGSHPDILYHLAAAMQSSGNRSEAKRLAEKALGLGVDFESKVETERLLRTLQ